MTFIFNESMAPILSNLMSEGKIFFDESTNDFVGIRPNGEEIGLGCNPDCVEKYLTDASTPESW